MVELRKDILGKSGIKYTIKREGKIFNLQGAYSTRREAVKVSKIIRKGGFWKARVAPKKFKGTGKYKGKTVYPVYGRLKAK